MAGKKDWWHVDERGRKIGWMWPEDMLVVIDSIWGRRKGIGGFSRYAGFSRTAVEHWCNGRSPIPKHIALLVELMQREVISRQRQDRNAHPHAKLPSADADWLPENKKTGLAKRPFG